MIKQFITRMMYIFSVLFILAGFYSFLLTNYFPAIQFLMFGFLIFPPLLNLLEKLGIKPSKTKRALFGSILIIVFIALTPSSVTGISQQNNNSNVTGSIDADKANPSSAEVVNKSIENNSKKLVNPDTANNETESSQTVESNNDSKDNASGKLTVHFLDVGQGDSILINVNEQFMLIDAGENKNGAAVVDYLKAQGVSELKYVIGTHPHKDHIGGLDNVINSFPIDKLIMPDIKADTQTFNEVQDAITDKKLKITKPVVGTEYKLGSAKFIILAPNSNKYKDLDNYSVVIKLTYGKTSFLLTGDAEDLSENEILKNDLDINADVIKLGQHGSSLCSSYKFIDAVGAASAIISVGESNKQELPARDTLIKVLDREMELYRTDEMGTIVASSDGKKITFDKKPDLKNLEAAIKKATVTSTSKTKPKPTTTPTPAAKPKTATKPTPAAKPKTATKPTPGAKSKSATTPKTTTKSKSTTTPKSTAKSKPTATVTPIPKQEIDEPETKEITVYVTKTGEKYHRDGCQYLRKSQIPISLDNAVDTGYGPCSKCDPPR